MADPTALVTALMNYVVDENRNDFTIKNAEALKQYGLVALNRSLGKVEFAAADNDLVPAGLVLGASDGNNTSHLTGDAGGTYKASCRGGLLLGGGRYDGVSVTGASAITDAGKFVWATDGQTLTLTRQTAPPVGIVIKWVSSTYCEVYLFSLIEALLFSALSAAPSTYELKRIGHVDLNAMSGTAALTAWIETSYEHYKIISWHALPTGFDAHALAGSQVFNLEIGGTTVKTTGGVNASGLTLAYTNCDAAGDMGTPVDATAVVSANEVHVGDTLELVMTASGTGFTIDTIAGFDVYAVIERLPGK